MFLTRVFARLVLPSVALGMLGCGGQPETVDDATVTTPSASKAPVVPTTPAPSPTPTPTTTAPAEARPGG